MNVFSVYLWKKFHSEFKICCCGYAFCGYILTISLKNLSQNKRANLDVLKMVVIGYTNIISICACVYGVNQEDVDGHAFLLYDHVYDYGVLIFSFPCVYEYDDHHHEYGHGYG